jgi:16S rRNA (guanine966-N2)-methyltransferase
VVKEAVFNMLGRLEGERVIDLFAGSGALGIEALSRAAAHVVFVERDDRAAAVIRRNLDALGYRERSLVVRAEAGR